MKTLTLIALITLGVVASACNQQTATVQYDYALVLMIDQTDSMALFPTAKAMLAPLNVKDNPFQGIRIKLVGINAEDITQTQTLTLERENPYTSNRIIREAKVRRFENQLQACLDSFHRTSRAPRSIIFRAVAKEAALLQQCPTGRKCLLVFSDLVEFCDDASFYRPETFALLQSNPGIIEKRLESHQLLPDLTGLQLFLLYSPKSYEQNNMYMPIAHFYERVYTAHHAVVHIGNQFALP